MLLHEHMMFTGFSVFFLFFLFSLSFILSFFFLSLSQMNRPIQVKPADSESRGGTVCNCLLLLLLPSLATFLLLFQPHNMLPVRINLTIMCPIRRSPVPRHRLTARPGKTLQYSEHIMLTVFFLAGEDSSSFSWRFIICIDASTCTGTHVSYQAWRENRSLILSNNFYNSVCDKRH